MTRHARFIPEFVLDNLDNIKTACSDKGLTMKDLAEASGCNYRYIAYLRDSCICPSADIYNKIADVLGWGLWHE